LEWDEALGKSSISRREIEQLNLHVAELNGCGYCISAHVGLARGTGMTPEEVAAARSGTGTNPRENALLALARRVVRTGGGGARGELARARAAGVDDAEIFDALAAIALMTFTNAAAQIGHTEVDFPRAENLPI